MSTPRAVSGTAAGVAGASSAIGWAFSGPSACIHPSRSSTGRSGFGSLASSHKSVKCHAPNQDLRGCGKARHPLFVAFVVVLALAPAATARANASWPPSGYSRWDSNVAFRQIPAARCGDLADHGCWVLMFAARAGCRDGLFVTVNEFRGKTLVGSVLGSVDVLPARTPARVELDGDVKGATGRIAKVECFRG